MKDGLMNYPLMLLQFNEANGKLLAVQALDVASPSLNFLNIALQRNFHEKELEYRVPIQKRCIELIHQIKYLIIVAFRKQAGFFQHIPQMILIEIMRYLN